MIKLTNKKMVKLTNKKMGCTGMDVKETGLEKGQNLQNMDLDLKNSLILYLSPKIPKHIKIGIYADITYHKKKGLEKIIKYVKTKFFIRNDIKKSFNHQLVLSEFLEKFPQFIKNEDIKQNINNVFSPCNILSDNYLYLFKSLNIPTNEKINFEICFIKVNDNDSNLLSKLNSIKEKFDKNFYIYNIKNNEDKYLKYEQYTFFFRENKINYWVENDCYNSNCFESLLNYYKFQNDLNNKSNNSFSAMKNELIQNYLNMHSKAEDEYIIRNKYYEYFDKEGNIIIYNEFPTFIITPFPNEHFNEQIIFIPSKQKININNYIINEIKKINSNINLSEIEVFKERIASFFI